MVGLYRVYQKKRNALFWNCLFRYWNCTKRQIGKKQYLFKLNKLTSLMLPHHRASIIHVILTLQQMGFSAILFKQCLTSHAERYSDMNGVTKMTLKWHKVSLKWPTCICHIYPRVVNIGDNSNCSVCFWYTLYSSLMFGYHMHLLVLRFGDTDSLLTSSLASWFSGVPRGGTAPIQHILQAMFTQSMYLRYLSI